MSAIARFGLVLSSIFRRAAPDPLVLAILLTLLTAALAILFGSAVDGAADDRSWTARRGDVALRVLDAWRADDGLWRLLGFAMQMSLILVSGYALAAAPMVRRGLERLARMPTGLPSAVWLVATTSCLARLVNWGLGLVVGAVLARDVGRSLAQRGIPAHHPLLCAAGYTCMLIWHGGFSGSAPLAVTTPEAALATMAPEQVATLVGDGIPLSETLFSPLNLVVSGGLLIIVPALMALMAPHDAAAMAPPPDADQASRRAARTLSVSGDSHGSGTFAERLLESRLLAITLGALLLVATLRFVEVRGIGSIGLNQVNGTMLALGALLHGSLARWMAAIEEAARGCAGILIQFPLYAGILAMLTSSGLLARFAEAMTDLGTPATVPVASFVTAGIVNLFVPSGGGQWAIQGPIALEAARSLGIAPGRMVMSVAYGDQLTNMLQPFWALPLLAIARVRASEIVGYTAIVMMAAFLWIALALVVVP